MGATWGERGKSITRRTTSGKPVGFRNHSTVAEVAHHVGASPRSVERWAAENKIPQPAHVTESGWKLWSPAQVAEILAWRRDKKKKR